MDNKEENINPQNIGNETNSSDNDTINNIHQSYNQLYFQIQKQILECRGRLKQIDGQKQLTGKNYKNEKLKLKKNIARLSSILTNPSAMIKFFNDMEKNQGLFNEALKQLEAMEKTKEDPSNKEQPNVESNEEVDNKIPSEKQSKETKSTKKTPTK